MYCKLHVDLYMCAHFKYCLTYQHTMNLKPMISYIGT